MVTQGNLTIFLGTWNKVIRVGIIPFTPVYLHSRNDNNKLENGQESNSVETTLNVKISNERFGKPRDSVGFSIMVGAFYDCIIPEDVESLWGPIPLQKLPPGVDNSCRAVTHG